MRLLQAFGLFLAFTFLIGCGGAVAQGQATVWSGSDVSSRRINGPSRGLGEVISGTPRQLAAGPYVRNIFQAIPQGAGLALFRSQLQVIDATMQKVRREPDMADAEEIAQRRYITGCIDFATLYGSLLRERGFKTRFIHGVSIDWLRQKQAGQRARRYKGHAFVQVFAEGQWQLIDAPAGKIYPNCPLTDRLLPRGYLVQFIGPDLWSFRIRNVRDLHASMNAFAKRVPAPAQAHSPCVGVNLRAPGQRRRKARF